MIKKVIDMPIYIRSKVPLTVYCILCILTPIRFTLRSLVFQIIEVLRAWCLIKQRAIELNYPYMLVTYRVFTFPLTTLFHFYLFIFVKLITTNFFPDPSNLYEVWNFKFQLRSNFCEDCHREHLEKGLVKKNHNCRSSVLKFKKS